MARPRFAPRGQLTIRIHGNRSRVRTRRRSRRAFLRTAMVGDGIADEHAGHDVPEGQGRFVLVLVLVLAQAAGRARELRSRWTKEAWGQDVPWWLRAPQRHRPRPPQPLQPRFGTFAPICSLARLAVASARTRNWAFALEPRRAAPSLEGLDEEDEPKLPKLELDDLVDSDLLGEEYEGEREGAGAEYDELLDGAE